MLIDRYGTLFFLAANLPISRLRFFPFPLVPLCASYSPFEPSRVKGYWPHCTLSISPQIATVICNLIPKNSPTYISITRHLQIYILMMTLYLSQFIWYLVRRWVLKYWYDDVCYQVLQIQSTYFYQPLPYTTIKRVRMAEGSCTNPIPTGQIGAEAFRSRAFTNNIIKLLRFSIF